MKRALLFLSVTCVLALSAQPVQAQEWSAEQLEVWETVSTLWDLQDANNPGWKDMLHDSFVGWVDESPAPHNKATTAQFLDAESGQFKVLARHLTPLAIAVAGNTAVVHYVHIAITEYGPDDQETTYGRLTDVLTRTGDGWKYVSWIGDERSEEEDDDM